MEPGSSQIAESLFNVSPADLNPGQPSDAYVEQYRLFLECLDKLSDRRQSANSYFLTVNTGICAAMGFLLSRDAAPETRSLCAVVPIAGILLNLFWHRLVASYRQLSTGKFAILHELEKHLPVAPYKAEWVVLGGGGDHSKYLPLTHIEVWIPRVFIAMYLVLALRFLPWGLFAGWIARCSG